VDERSQTTGTGFARVIARWVPVGLLFIVTAASCARDVTEEDCRQVGEHLREVWTAEAKFPQTGGASADKAVAVIKSQGSALEESWKTQCRKELIGTPRASGEFSCMLHAKTLADVKACATIPEH